MKKIMLTIIAALSIGLPAFLQGMESPRKKANLEMRFEVKDYENSFSINAYHVQELAGSIIMMRTDEEGMKWHLFHLKVEEKYRNRKISKDLFELAFKILKEEHNPKEISWHAFPSALSLAQLTEVYRRLCNHVQPLLPGTFVIGKDTKIEGRDTYSREMRYLVDKSGESK